MAEYPEVTADEAAAVVAVSVNAAYCHRYIAWQGNPTDYKVCRQSDYPGGPVYAVVAKGESNG